jgi:hypothetical protein
MRRRYVWSPEKGALVEVTQTERVNHSAMIVPDLPGYESPVTGKWVEGRKARREDLKRTGSRPYEGRAAEMQIANSYRESVEREMDRKAEAAAVDVWQHSPERIRRVFK